MRKTTSRREQIESWPDLSYIYGFTYDEIASMPYVILNVYIEAIPRLLAGAQLRAIEAASFPHQEADVQRTVMNRLKECFPEDKVEEQKPGTIDQLGIMAMAAGIGFVIEEKPDA